jgi:hypothetical protein
MDNHRGPLALEPTPARRQGRTKRIASLGLAFGLAVLLSLSPAGAQGACMQPERNVQCTEFGTIAMDSQRDIRGKAIEVTTDVHLNTGYEDRGTRWLLFSIRNVEADGSNPVTIQLDRFSSPYGDVVTTRVDHNTANELNLWVDILDLPIGMPIELKVNVGATERGAFRLETLVMAFDRGYAPIQVAGSDASLFSFTLLGVNEETGAISPGGDSFLDGKKLPALGLIPLLAAVGAAVAAVALTGRRLR